MADVAGEHRDPGLRRGVGFSGVLFQSITFMAPAIATAFSIPAGIAFSGGGAPLSVIFALFASLLAAVSIGQLSKHMPTAGSHHSYDVLGATTQRSRRISASVDPTTCGRLATR